MGDLGLKSRIEFIDTLKVLAIFGVITIHICAIPLINLKIMSLNWIFSVFLASIIRWSVPVFLMCSGVLFLNSNKVIGVKQLFTKYLLRIVSALFVWAIFYELIKIFRVSHSSGYIEQAVIIKSIKNILTLNTQTHLYYLYIIILIYALLPIIRVFTDAASKQQMEYALIAWIFLGIVFPYAVNIYPFTRLKGIVLQYAITMVYSAIGYFVLGHYLQIYTLKKKTTCIIYLLGIMGLLITIGGTIIKSISKQALNTMYLEGMAPNVAAMAAALFLFIKNQHGKTKDVGETLISMKRKITRYISKASFCIYLVHVSFIIVLKDLNFPFLAITPLVTVPLVVLLIFLLSLGVYCVLSKIPIVNKYFI